MQASPQHHYVFLYVHAFNIVRAIMQWMGKTFLPYDGCQWPIYTRYYASVLKDTFDEIWNVKTDMTSHSAFASSMYIL